MRILFIVPKMFAREELTRINPSVPEDYEKKSQEFWDYVAERLKSPRVVNRIYYDSLTKGGEQTEEALKFINDNNERCSVLVRELISDGATLQASEDRLLIEETVSWIGMLTKGASKETEQDQTTLELLEQNMSDRDKFLAKVVEETLKENETGVLFIGSGREIGRHISSDIKVIKIQPFEPADYLNSWLVTLKLRSKEEKSGS
jgi:hypothetical protein